MTWTNKRELINLDGETAIKIEGNEALTFESEIKKFPSDYSVSFNKKLNSRVYEVRSDELKEIIHKKGELVNLIEKEKVLAGKFFVLIDVPEETQKIEFQNQDEQSQSKMLEDYDSKLRELRRQFEAGEINNSQFKEKLVRLEKAKQEISKQKKDDFEGKLTNKKNNDDKGGNAGACALISGSSFLLFLFFVAEL